MREAPNSDLLDRIAEDFQSDKNVAMGTMFRSPGLRVRDKIFVFLGHKGQLIVKLPSDRAQELIAKGTAEEMVMGGRTMREWIAFPPEEDPAATLATWREAAHEAHRYVSALSGPSRS